VWARSQNTRTSRKPGPLQLSDRVQTIKFEDLIPRIKSMLESKILSSDVRDIHDVLEVTVYDEDSAHKSEFLGKVSMQ
jgi:hypothetical protein